MKIEEQLDMWVDGNPQHNNDRNECTPDFSCCRGKDNMAPKHLRLEFAKAYREGDIRKTDQMLSDFLSGILSKECPDYSIRVSGFKYGGSSV